MCGLFCYCEIPSDNSPLLLEKALKHLSLLNNRGPDNSSYRFLPYKKFNLFLAHTRLAIQDTSALYNQPFINKITGSQLIYNGEIYDYGGYNKKFSDFSSDTTALSQILEEKNFDLSQIDGMYSFVHWNAKKNILTIARDRFGIKPLFIHKSKNLIAFSSSLRLLSKVFSLKEINQKYLQDVIFVGHPLDNGTAFEKIEEFPINQKTIFNPNTFEIFSRPIYINEVFKSEKSNYKFEPAKLESLLIRSLERELGHSDRGSGLFLSGGVDSSLLVSIAAKGNLLKPSKNPLYSINVKCGQNDESERIEKFKSYLGKRNNLDFNDSYFNSDSVEEILLDYKDLDYPVMDLGIFPMMKLCKGVENNIKVVLSGDGADELFGGYERDRIAFKRFSIINNVPKLIRNYLSKILKPKISKYLRIENIFELRLVLMGTPPSFAKSRTSKIDINKDIFQELLLFEQKTYLRSVLAKVDAASMRYSLEIRVPYLSNLIANYISKNHINFLNYPVKYELKELLKSYTSREFAYLNKKGLNVGDENIIDCINYNLRSTNKLEVLEDLKEMVNSSPIFQVRLNLLSYWINANI
tara:strand:+ start:1464 stop:3206 length:1743 start_codon:yes stop_codon:yes gene_type:complete